VSDTGDLRAVGFRVKRQGAAKRRERWTSLPLVPQSLDYRNRKSVEAEPPTVGARRELRD